MTFNTICMDLMSLFIYYKFIFIYYLLYLYLLTLWDYDDVSLVRVPNICHIFCGYRKGLSWYWKVWYCNNRSSEICNFWKKEKKKTLVRQVLLKLEICNVILMR